MSFHARLLLTLVTFNKLYNIIICSDTVCCVSRTVTGPASVAMQRSADTGGKDALAATATRLVLHVSLGVNE